MILYINKKNEIKDVNATTDEKLTPVEFHDEIVESWSPAKICCYKVVFDKNGDVSSLKNYVDIKLIEHIERQGQENINLQAQVDYLAMMTDVEMM